MAKIVLWLGPAVERWGVLTALDTGIGGSETAAIHMSRELALLGHEVVVYADVTEARANRRRRCWSFSTFGRRRVVALQQDARSPSLRSLHLVAPAGRSKAAFASLQKSLALGSRSSLWSRLGEPSWGFIISGALSFDLGEGEVSGYYPRVDSSKVVVTSNAVNGDLFSALVAMNPEGYGVPGDQHLLWALGKIPFRATFSSSPDRGLSKLLDLWPEICKVATISANPLPPELHVYYGFEIWAKMAELQGRTEDLLKMSILREKMKRTAGVVYHGRAGQDEIARSHLLSCLWLYPTDFEETSCITAMEAQAARSRVVATKCGALPETVKYGYFVDGPTTRSGYDEAFLEAVRDALSDDFSVGLNWPWSNVAQQWDAWIREEGI